MMAVAAALMCGCEKQIMSNDVTGDDGQSVKVDGKRFVFTCKGDFGSPTFADSDQNDASVCGTGAATRGYLQADGQDMTDLWVFDFMDGECVQTVHQEGAGDAFGRPEMSLAYGIHHVYFVASRGAEPTVDQEAKTITWTKPSDTFWKDYDVTVVATSNGNRAVTLDRVATRLRVVINDEIPTVVATLSLTPAVWYYGMNYQTGEPAVVQQGTERSVAVPASYIGTSGQLAMSIFGLGGADEWSTDVSVTAKDGDGNVVGQATITGAPFKANRVTEYSGNLFAGVGGTVSLGLNGEWQTVYSGTW